jgi:hypothetical protein
MRDILTIYSDPLTDRIRIGFNKYPKTVVGVQNLLQIIVKYLLTQLSTNHFSPEVGSNLFSLIGEGATSSEQDNLRNGVAMVINEVEETIKSEQAKEVGLRPEEKLDSLKIISLDYSISGQLSLDLSVKTKATQIYALKI